MVCHCSVPDGLPQPKAEILNSATPLCPAKALTPPKRQQLAVEALAGTETVSRLASQHAVSRKFVYQQTAKVEEALDAAFSPKQPDDERVLFISRKPSNRWPRFWRTGRTEPSASRPTSGGRRPG